MKLHNRLFYIQKGITSIYLCLFGINLLIFHFLSIKYKICIEVMLDTK